MYSRTAINQWAVYTQKPVLVGIANILPWPRPIRAVDSVYSLMEFLGMPTFGSMDFFWGIIKVAMWVQLLILPIIFNLIKTM